MIKLILICLLQAWLSGVICTDRKDSQGLRAARDIVYQPSNDYVLTLETDVQTTSETESIHLKFRTLQQENSVLAYGRTNEHSFKIELVDGRVVFQFTDDSDLTISSYSLPAKNLNDGEWHRLNVERKGSKFEVLIDGTKYSEVSFNKVLTENVFAGSRITLGLNNELNQFSRYDGEISEVVISLNNAPVKIREFPVAYNELYPGLNFPEHSNGIDKVIIRVDMAPGANVAFRPHDPPITLAYAEDKHVDSFGVSFLTSSDGIVASLIGTQLNFIGLEVVEQRLFLVVQNHPSERAARKSLGSVEYNAEHTVHLRNDRQGDLGVISAWLTSNRQSPVSFRVNDPFLVKKISFGGEARHDLFVNSRPIIGCISKPYLNLFTLNLQPLIGAGREDCSMSSQYAFASAFPLDRSLIDHVEAISFRSGDRPLPFTYAENDRKEFKSLELDFATLASSGIIASLHDSGDNFIAVYIKRGLLYLTIDDKNIEQQSFKVSELPVNDGAYHRIRIVNAATPGKDYAELDGLRTNFPKQLSDRLFLTTVYFAAADFWAKDHYSLGSEGNFFGCMRNILFNGEHIIRYDHVLDKSRINAKCQPTVKPRVPAVTYLEPDVSFSCRQAQDALNIKLSNSEEFNSLTIPLSTVINDGVIASLSSTVDLKTIFLYIQSGGLNLAYGDNSGKELHLNTGKLINDGQQHRINLKRDPVLGQIILQVNSDSFSIDLPIGSSPLFFDTLVVGGSDSASSFIPGRHSNVYQGCFKHIEYNKASVVPVTLVPPSRQQCRITGNSICDAGKQCLNVIQAKSNTPSFCSSRQCVLFCQAHDQSIVSIRRPIAGSKHYRIGIRLRTNILNAQLFKTDDPNGVGLTLTVKNGYAMLAVGNQGRSVNLEFPRLQISDAHHHMISIKIYQKQMNLTVDEQTNIHYVNDLEQTTPAFDHHVVCSGDYQGYIHDLIMSTDNEEVNILGEIVENPALAVIGPGAVWENRYTVKKRDAESNCNCGQGKRECRPKRDFNKKLHIRKQMCVCIDADDTYDTNCEPSADPCSRILCLHGTCVAETGRPVCQCDPGFVGESCDRPADPCQSQPCQNGGTCYPQGSIGFICYCTAEFTGHYCETPVRQIPVDLCYHVKCQNGGVCYNGRCQCTEGFTGEYCEQPLQDPCRHVVCQNGGRCVDGRCSCPAGFTGSYCEIYADACYGVVCANGGQCENGQCRCPPGFFGLYCTEMDPCHNVHCYNDGICDQGKCRCRSGYYGDHCELLDKCYGVQCLNNGQCVDGVCHCATGFTGVDCSERDPCSGIVCMSDGHCRDGRCICPAGYGGAFCEVRVNPCINIKCYNGGRCEHGTCVCAQRFSGPTCEIYDNCELLGCSDHGFCIDGRCVCEDGYEGLQCDALGETIDANDRPVGCTDCLNYENCEDCNCPVGYSGPHCELKDLCTGMQCQNGVCVEGHCLCLLGFHGEFCEELDVCYAVNCINGRCSDGVCVCEPGYSGDHCEIRDACFGVNCVHGRCVDGRCECDDGFTGPFCDELLPPPPGWHSLDQPQGGLIEYGRLPRSRGKHLGAIFALASGLALGALAGAFAARKCAEGACSPGASTVVTTIPVIRQEGGAAHPIASMMERTVPTVFTTSAGRDVVTSEAAAASTMFEQSRTEDQQLLLPDAREGGGASAGAGQTEKIETIHERTIERDYGAGNIGMYAGFPMMGPPIVAAPYAAYGDFHSPWPQEQERLVEAHMFDEVPSMAAGGASFAYQPPPIGDFGYGTGGHISQQVGYSDAESWEAATGIGPSNLQMNAMGAAGMDYELSNINTVTMTPNGKYAIVGQSQGPPQIWDAQNGNLINSLSGNCNNCTQLALACNGTLLVGLSSDVTDTQPCVVQIWDVNTGRPIHLSHQIKCSTFTLSNNTNNLVMAGNQKYGRGISVGILDLVSNELTKELKSDTQTTFGRDPSFIALTPDERHAVIGCHNHTQGLTNFVVFDLTVGVDIIQPPYISLDCDPKRCVVLNNRECITGLNNGQLFVWDLHTCKPVHYFSDSNLDRTAHRSQIRDLKLSADRSLLITASKDGTAKIWDTVGRNLLTRLLGHHSEVTCACLASNQMLAVTGSLDQNICLWRLPSGQLAAQMNIGMTPTEVHMASQNRTVVAIAEKDGECQLLMLKVVSSALPQSSSSQR